MASPGSSANAYDAADQRSYAQPIDGDGNGLTCDIGALEVGSATMVYAYDKLYRLTNANYGAAGVFTYTYDAVGNRPITIKQGTTLTYTYNYNGLGDRVQQTVNSVPTTYTLDLNAGLTQVLNDGANTYLYGNDRIAQQSVTTTAYFLGDALGSVRQSANASGAVTLARSYQPCGSVLSSAGSGANIYGFTGEQTDNTGLIFLRARYYASQWGRFLTADTPSPIQSIIPTRAGILPVRISSLHGGQYLKHSDYVTRMSSQLLT